MSLLDDIEPEVAAIVEDAVIGFATWGWHKLTNDKDTESAKKAIGAIADKAKQAMFAAALEHLQQLAGALDIPDALAQLAAGAQGVQDAWAEAEARGKARMTSTLEPYPEPAPDPVATAVATDVTTSVEPPAPIDPGEESPQ